MIFIIVWMSHTMIQKNGSLSDTVKCLTQRSKKTRTRALIQIEGARNRRRGFELSLWIENFATQYIKH